ncbi:IS66 family insertion sequence element accessory protein TnpA [Verrucomicrobiota bacterium sgz303538]
MTTERTVLRSDTKGRVRMPAERREALLDEFEASSLSVMKFAALAGVKYATFANWIQRRRKSRAAAEANDGAGLEPAAERQPVRPVRLFEAFAEVGRAAQASALQVELPGGARLLVDSPGQLRMAAELLQMLNTAGGRRGAC